VQARVVRHRVLLRLVARRRVDQHRGVTALHVFNKINQRLDGTQIRYKCAVDILGRL
jgi:hypothetical protein